MIYTVTFSPALDYVMRIPELILGEVNRSVGETVFAGGKGINVSVVLKRFGIQSVALGFVAGFTGTEVERLLAEEGVQTDFVRAGGLTRINVKVKAESETDLNGRGAEPGEREIDLLLKKTDAVRSGDTLVIAGAVPAGISPDSYERILQRVDGRGVRAVVDATGDLLLRVLPYRPFLVKPNQYELGEIFGIKLTAKEDVCTYAIRLRELGAQNVLVSMGAEGALLAGMDGSVRYLAAPTGRVINSVGAGDSMVAGFLAGYDATASLEHALHCGIAAGSATAFSEGLASYAEIEGLLQKINKP